MQIECLKLKPFVDKIRKFGCFLVYNALNLHNLFLNLQHVHVKVLLRNY